MNTIPQDSVYRQHVTKMGCKESTVIPRTTTEYHMLTTAYCNWVLFIGECSPMLKAPAAASALTTVSSQEAEVYI